MSLMGSPAIFCSNMEGTSSTQPPIEEDLRSMLRALPTIADIEALILRIEEAHSKDIQEVKADLHNVENRVTSGESRLTALEDKVQALEQSQHAHSLGPRRCNYI